MIALAVILLLLGGVAAFALTRGEGTANVPLVLGDTVADARAKIERAGFDFAQVTAPTCSPKDTVTEQDPPARASADEGSTVTVTVSLGLEKQVPDVVGLAEQDAVARIKKEDLLAKSESQASRVGEGRARDLHRPRCGLPGGVRVDGHARGLQGRQRDHGARPGGRPAGGGGVAS